MNTIPTTFNGTAVPYTVIGGKEHSASSGISAVILSRNNRLPRRIFLQELEKMGFDNVISIESSSANYEIEELSKHYPFVSFIVPQKEINLGEQINLAASEIKSPLFFVLRGDSKIIAGGTAKKMAERLSINHDENEEEDEETKKMGFERLCTVPIIMNSRYEVLRTLVTPITNKRKMKTMLTEPKADGDLTLYPFDGVGIYNRLRFIQSGGYDITLKNTHWQLMDFGFRSHLWGEEIAFCHQLKISYNEEQPTEYLNTESSYLRFYLKNLAPVFQRDHAYLPIRRFPSFFFKSGEDPFTAWEEFSDSRRWVKTNQFRWKCDAHDVTKRFGDL